MLLFVKTKNFLRNLFSPRSVESDLDLEVHSHLEMLTEENLRAGMSPEEAQRAARIELGGIEQVKEQVRQQRLGNWLHSVYSDCRFALRQLCKDPGFTSVTLLTIALGIGVNTAIFSVIDAVLLRPLPFHDPGRLVACKSVDVKDSTQGGDISYPAFLDWRAQAHSLQAMSVYNVTSFTYTGGAQPESIRSAVVSSNLFSTLGISPAFGRTFANDEDQPGNAQPPVILSYEFWQSHFAGDPNVLGQPLTLDSEQYTVVGIMPPSFQFPVQKDRVELWVTIAHDLKGKLGMATQRGASYLDVIARRKPGIEIPQAQSDLQLIQQRLNRQYPENRPRGVVIESEADDITGSVRPMLLVLLGAVAFVLLIACANVASLLLARATVRQKEFTVRLALGAGRATIVRQLLVESTVLALLGGALGLFIAYWATNALVAMTPDGLARASEIHLDFRVLAFTFLVALATGVLFGLAPAIQASRLNLQSDLGASARNVSTGSESTRLRSALVISQLSVSFVLLIGAGLLLRSFDRLLHVDPGFRPNHVLTFVLDVPLDRHPRAQRTAFVEQLLRSTRALPGVQAASAVFGLPLDEDRSAFTTLEIEGRPVAPSQRPRTAFRLIESQYFQTMGIRLLKGRTFSPEDEQGELPVAIVNETLVRKLFDGQNPIGHRIKANIGFGENEQPPLREIVGVVADVKSGGIGENAVPEVYAPQTPTDFIGETTIVVRTATDPNAFVSTMRSLVASMDKELPLRDVKTLDDYVSASISAQRFQATLLSIFAALAFVLTAIGLYGVIAYSVAQRSREIGIRIALGAEQQNISRMVLRQGAWLALIGVATGLLASLFAARLIRALLYGIQPIDPITFMAVPLLFFAVALLASYIPARRASRVDPMVALRYE
ncbi:MAG: ABC transporter permease [Candidatus Acidiferrum sp.]